MLFECGITPHGSTDIRHYTTAELKSLEQYRQARREEVG